MAEAAVEFLLENLNQVLLNHAYLIQDAKSEVENLEKDLRLFKAFLKDSTKNRNKDETAKELVLQIRDIVYEIEDVIDSFITQAADNKTKTYFTRSVRSPATLISVAKNVEKIREKVKSILDRNMIDFFTGDTPETEIAEEIKVPKVREDNIVGFDEEAQKIINYLMEETEELDVISIIGLPGLGKTTLAGKVYRDIKIQYEFPTRIWVYVSQEFKRRDVFLAILSKFINNTDGLKRKNDLEIAEILRGHLQKGRFLIVMDDVWSAEAWIELMDAFPRMHRTGKILITSRNEEVALEANRNRVPYKLRFLNFDESLLLLHLEVFGKPHCPQGLDTYGKIIARKCAGLPLAIVVIGGILVKSLSGDTMTRKNTWRKVSESVSTYLKEDSNLENIIALSYNKLPDYLRPCFLYLGMFPEDFEIPVWTLIRLWIAEGFIPQKPGITLEQTAQDYLEELVKRNLVMVDKMSTDGKIKTCRVHDTLHQFCKNESSSQRENFLQEMTKIAGGFEPSTTNIENFRRLCIHSDIVDFMSSPLYGPRVRSLLISSKEPFVLPLENASSIPSAFKLLRVLDAKPVIFTKFPRDLTHMVHLRYIVLSSNFQVIPEAIADLWNLQTFVVYTSSRVLNIKANIWKMLQLRHVKTNASAILPKRGKSTKELGEKLQTLGTISPQSCTEDAFGRLHNLRKLGIRGRLVSLLDVSGLDKLDNLDKLKLVNDLYTSPSSGGKLPRLPEPNKFPPKLRSLTLCATYLDWVHMSTLGMLDTLEVLKLKENAFMGKCWEVSTEHFRHLEVLHIERTDLEIWVVEANHFPRLKCLVLRNCEKLQVIPSKLSEIQPFQRLDMEHVTISAVSSARKIEGIKKWQWEQEPDVSKRIKFNLFIAPDDYYIPKTEIVEEVKAAIVREESVLSFEDEEMTELDLIYIEGSVSREGSVVGFEDDVQSIIVKLKEETEDLDVISIVGMPGIGKTTLADKVFQEMKAEFDICKWIHVPHEYRKRDIFLTILRKFKKVTDDLTLKTDHEIAKTLRELLETRKFLIVLDDIWSPECWIDLSLAIPKSNRKGKVLITTQNEEVALEANSCRQPHKLRFRTFDESWKLLQSEVFGKLKCPPDLRKFGANVVEKCGGLPLAIVVTGGILLEKALSRDAIAMKNVWRKVSGSLSAYLKEDAILDGAFSLSYNQLPDYLRPCFLYLGIFPTELGIPVSKLIRLWIAEGFIQHKIGVTLEQTAYHYVEQLVKRNLVMVDKMSSSGQIKTCRLYHLMHEFCKTMAGTKRENLFQEITSPQGGFEPPLTVEGNYRRVCIHSNIMDFISSHPSGPLVRSFVCISKEEQNPLPAFKLLNILDAKPVTFIKFPRELGKLVRSFVCISKEEQNPLPTEEFPSIPATFKNLMTLNILEKLVRFYVPIEEVPSFPAAFKLLKILDAKPVTFTKFPRDLEKLVHLKYIVLSSNFKLIPKAISKLWSLQTLVVYTTSHTLEIKANIWKMMQLRHVETNASAMLPKTGKRKEGDNLQILGTISPQSCTEDIFARACNLRKLGIRGPLVELLDVKGMDKLDKLEKLKLVNDLCNGPNHRGRPLTRLPYPNKFPPNLRSLTLCATYLKWSETCTLEMLDNLEVLKLKENAFIGYSWKASAGGFCRLEVLQMECLNLVMWEVEAYHYPKLRCLLIKDCNKLVEIPCNLGKVESLWRLELVQATDSAAASARKIKEAKQDPSQRMEFQLTIDPEVELSTPGPGLLKENLNRMKRDPEPDTAPSGTTSSITRSWPDPPPSVGSASIISMSPLSVGSASTMSMPPPYYPPHLLTSMIVKQIDYYFSDVNLAKDAFLRSNMDKHGWVSIAVIASFWRIKQLTMDIPLILNSLKYSTVVEVQDGKVRRRADLISASS